jgi:YD repeat-containing protein
LRRLDLLVLAATLASTAAQAAETMTYSYDAKGRLVKIVRSGSVNNGVTTDYTHDKADNRKVVIVIGSTNPPPP